MPGVPVNLARFMPYRLSVVTDAVSRSLAAVYADRFDLTRDEWRVLAQLADGAPMKSTELGLRTSLPKMQVSRALARLEADGLVRRETDRADRRNHVVNLTREGRALYARVEPLVLEREAYLMAALSAEERMALERALEKVETRAKALREAAPAVEE